MLQKVSVEAVQQKIVHYHQEIVISNPDDVTAFYRREEKKRVEESLKLVINWCNRDPVYTFVFKMDQRWTVLSVTSVNIL